MPTRQLSFPQPPESALNHTIVTTHKCFPVTLSPAFEFGSLRKLKTHLRPAPRIPRQAVSTAKQPSHKS